MGSVATLTAHALSVGYGQKNVASGIEFEIWPGEITCLLGPNGAGKTTLFKTLLRLLSPLSGEVLIEGRTISQIPQRTVAQKIAYVPQAQAPDFGQSVFDLVLMGRTAHLGPFAMPGASDREHAVAALETLGIADLAESDSTQLSGGQRQLVLIARALAQDASIIVMDEPTASLDLANRLLVLGQVRALAKRGLSVILSTHEPDHVFAMADKVALLSKASPFSIGTPDEIMTAQTLSRAYGAPLEIETTRNGKRLQLPAI